MPLDPIVSVINSLDSDSERDALSAAMGKRLRLMIEKEIADRSAAVEAEKRERIAADNALWEALRQEIADRKQAVANEKSARENADNAEKSARENADNAEKSAREAADTAEKNARIAADNALGKRIDDLTFDDIDGMLPGERVWATGYTPRPGS